MKILIVDDDRLCIELVSKVLDKAGHDLVTASDGAEAIAKAKAQEFDLIITDIHMPNRDGMEVIQKIRTLHPGVKFIAMSASETAEYTTFKIAQSMGASGSLQKPFTAEQLLAKVAEAAQG